MADYLLTFNIPEADAVRARDGLAGSFGYDPDNELGETKAQFIHRKMIQAMKARVKKWEEAQAIAAIEVVSIEVT